MKICITAKKIASSAISNEKLFKVSSHLGGNQKPNFKKR
ncbi:hypothetical protein Mpsy_2510 [Methanolobus psychrophilus R15]|nr:hypothetical protein Mpsy_2510 [Methanolobus psychrophilus R15]